MSYIINLTEDGQVLTTIQDGTTNTQTGLTLIGRNYPSYGEIQNENFVKLLESFSDTIPPTESVTATTPLKGTVWYDSGNQRLRVYDGTNWSNVSERFVANTAPTTILNTIKTGDQWFHSVDQQLYTWNGTTWILVGPAFPAGIGKSGTVVETVQDISATNHTVVATYTNNNLISITSYDAEFAPLIAIPGFGNIKPGVNLRSGEFLNGTSTNTNLLSNVALASFARVDQQSTFTQLVKFNDHIVLSNANIYVFDNALTFNNRQYQGNVSFVVNSNAGTITALNINGSTGTVTVNGDPVAVNGVATKGYVDDNFSELVDDLQNVANQFYANLVALQADYVANITALNNDVLGANAATADVSSNVSTLADVTTTTFEAANVVTANIQTQVNAINSYLLTIPVDYAPLISPNFSGNPRVPTATLGDNDTTIASTAFVTAAGNVLTADYTIRISNEVTARGLAISQAVAPLAPIASPTFTGTPTAPTPSQGDSSTKLATTAFVNFAVQASKFRYTVSTNPPSGGVDGDFWFQVS